MVQGESLLHNREKAARGIDLYVNIGKTKTLPFNQQGSINFLWGKTLKLIDQSSYLERKISSAKSELDIRVGKERVQ